MKKLSNTLKKALLFALVGVMLVGTLAFGGCSLFDKDEQPSDGENPPIVAPDDGEDGQQPDDGNGTQDSQQPAISLPKSMSFSAPMAQDESGILLQATVKPTNAYNKEVDWSVEWNPYILNAVEVNWAGNNDVNDYIQLTPLSDGSNTCTVKCLQPFKASAKITVTSRADADVKASCDVDYILRMPTVNLGVGLTHKPEGSDVYTFSKQKDFTFKQTESASADVSLDYMSSFGMDLYLGYLKSPSETDIKAQYSDAVYSEGPVINSFKISVKITDALRSALSAKGITPAISDYISVVSTTISSDGSEAVQTNGSLAGVEFTNTLCSKIFGIKKGDAQWENLTNAIAQASSGSLLYKLELNMNYGNYTYYCKVKLNAESMITPTSIELNNANLYV